MWLPQGKDGKGPFETEVFLVSGSWASQVALVVKNPPANAGNVRDGVRFLDQKDPLVGGHGNPLQYSCLENPMNRGAWWATVHGVTKSQTGQ